MKIAVSSYSFQPLINDGLLTHPDCVAKAKELGFDAIEFTEMQGRGDIEKQQECARLCRKNADELGVEIYAYALGADLCKETEEERKEEIERLKKQLDIAKILGVKVVRHDACYTYGNKYPRRSFEMMLPFIVEATRELADYAESLGIRTCSENHGLIVQDSDRMERLFNAVCHENYGLLIDIGNFTCVDEDHVKAVSRLAPYAIHAHAKDMIIRNEPTKLFEARTRGGNYFCGTVIGEGDVPVRKCIEALKLAKYDGFLTIEFEGPGNCIDNVARSLYNLRSILSEIN